MDEIKNEEDLAKLLKALANPIRLRIISHLSREPMNVYELAKKLKLSYPLTFLHVKTLKALRLVGKVREEKSTKGLLPIKYYGTSDFKIDLSSETIREIVEKERR